MLASGIFAQPIAEIMIYRIATSADWRAAQRNGEFASADLAQEGFIHCSERVQVLRTAHKYYAGQRGLVLLEIDEALIAASIRREDLAGRGEKFPHAYAPIPLVAIVRHIEFGVGDDGLFSLPAEV